MQDKAVPEVIARPLIGGELRVFLVEDVLRTRELMAELFTVIGHVAIAGSVTNEGEAKLWMDEHPFAWDLAVVDLILEAGSGMGVIPYSKKVHPAAKVVVFSGYVSPVLRQHCERLGADAMFHKDESAAFVSWIDQLVAQVVGTSTDAGGE